MISAEDLHRAAKDPLMNPTADPAKDPAEAIGLEPDAVARFFQESSFAFPHPGGIPHNLDKQTFYSYLETLEGQSPPTKNYRVAALATAFHLGYNLGLSEPARD